MIAYVGVAPIAAAVADQIPRRRMLVVLDLVRATVALLLPFVTEIWQVYACIFLFRRRRQPLPPPFKQQFPTFCQTRRSTHERFRSPGWPMTWRVWLARCLLRHADPSQLSQLVCRNRDRFPGLCSTRRFGNPAQPKCQRTAQLYDRINRGIRIYLATPRLRGLLAINMAVAAAGAVVIVNTVVYVQTALALEIVKPRWPWRHLEQAPCWWRWSAKVTGQSIGSACHDHRCRTFGHCHRPHGNTSVICLAYWPVVPDRCRVFIRTNANGTALAAFSACKDRPSVFAAQFALSHACWM